MTPKSKKYQFAVITDVGNDNGGNYACSELLIDPDADKHVVGSNIIVDAPIDEDLFVEAVKFRDSGANTIDLTKRQMLFCNTPVFKLGEIMVVDRATDRTVPDDRKPSKWDVGCEYFDDVESAIKRAKEVTE